MSRRRRPILSPPGLAMTALPMRASSGPIIRNAILRASAWKVKTPFDVDVTFTPTSFNSWMRLLTSRMLGILLMVTGSWVSNVAQMTCSASFLAPCGVMVPLSRCPPSILNVAISYFFFFLLLPSAFAGCMLSNWNIERSSWMMPSVKRARSSATRSSSTEPLPHAIRSRFIWLAV